MTFVLRSTSTHQGKPLWFKQMTAIGPMTTAEPDERATFETREDAASSPATRHLLATFEIEEVR